VWTLRSDKAGADRHGISLALTWKLSITFTDKTGLAA
jgi:hypothetical protein